MSKKYSLNNKEIGYSYCECGNYLYSDTEKVFRNKLFTLQQKYQSEIIDVWFR